MLSEQPLVSSNPHLRRDDHEDERPGHRQPAEALRRGFRRASTEHPHSSSNAEEEQRYEQENHRDAHQPSRDGFPCGQREQIEGKRAAEDGIHGRRAGWQIAAAAVPPQCEHRPVVHHSSAGDRGDHNGSEEGHETQRRTDGQPDGAAVQHEDAVGAEFGEARRLQEHEAAVQEDERDQCEAGEHARLDREGLPEHLPIAERPEPERVHVVRHERLAGDEEKDDECENPGAETAFGPPRRILEGDRGLTVKHV